MNTEKIETPPPHQDGPAWKVDARFSTFEEADMRRTKLSKEKDLQVKVRLLGPQSKPYFAVKTRTDPAVVQRVPTNKNKNRKKK